MDNSKNQKPTVLIADDVPENIDILATMLAKEYDVKVALNGEDALSIASRSPFPDLILLDVMMPEMDGIEACRRLKENASTKTIPVIFITALSDTEDKVKAFNAGGVDYISKPFAREEVMARVKVHLANTLLTREVLDANKNLRKLNRLKNKLLGVAAHDLRNPLGSIKAFSEILLSDDSDNLNAQQNMFISRISRASEEMLELINELLDVSVIESGKLELNLKPVSFLELIENGLDLMRVIAEKKGITICTSLSDIGEIAIDANRISQVIGNLISNAIKYSPPGSTINIKLIEGDEFIELSIRDNGAGIPEAEQSRLFGEFQRLSPQPTGGEKSTGLGLSISKKIATAHFGDIIVDSQVNAGSTFTLLLPKSPFGKIL